MSYQREFDRYLNVGLVGAGSHSYRNLLPVLNFLPVRLRAVCDISREAAERTAAQYGCRSYTRTEHMYSQEKLDAVFLCVGPRQHPALGKEAMDAGHHVWVEKPVSVRPRR
jgi:predicted dehydrogenase